MANYVIDDDKLKHEAYAKDDLDPILNTVTEVKVVTSLPSDASSHTTTLYLIKE